MEGRKEDCSIQIEWSGQVSLRRRAKCEGGVGVSHTEIGGRRGGEQLRGSRKAKPVTLLPRFEGEPRGQCSRAWGSRAGMGPGQSRKG